MPLTTYDYDKFVSHSINRPIDKYQVNRLKVSTEDLDMLKYT